METLIKLFVDFQKKYAEENMGSFDANKLDAIQALFLKLYKQNIDDKMKAEPVQVVKNDQGHLEHPGTKLVFLEHPDFGHVVIGKMRNNKVVSLTIHDILTCFTKKWKYNISNCIGSAKQSSDCIYAVQI